jgi:hypothetical protein
MAAAPVTRPKGGHGARLRVVLRVDADRYPYLLGLRLSPNRSQVRKSNAEAVKADGVQSPVKEVQCEGWFEGHIFRYFCSWSRSGRI